MCLRKLQEVPAGGAGQEAQGTAVRARPRHSGPTSGTPPDKPALSKGFPSSFNWLISPKETTSLSNFLPVLVSSILFTGKALQTQVF